MTACEHCWTEASRRALLLGGSTPDRYREVLMEHSDGHATTGRSTDHAQSGVVADNPDWREGGQVAYPDQAAVHADAYVTNA